MMFLIALEVCKCVSILAVQKWRIRKQKLRQSTESADFRLVFFLCMSHS
jgi:hypothetical protein